MQNEHKNNTASQYNYNRTPATSTCQMLMGLYNNSAALITNAVTVASDAYTSFANSRFATEPVRRLTQSAYDPIAEGSANAASSHSHDGSQAGYQGSSFRKS